jgi:lipid A 3-O-deacylase
MTMVAWGSEGFETICSTMSIADPQKSLIGALMALAWAAGTATADDAGVAWRFADVDVLGRTPHYVDAGIGVFDILSRVSTSRRSVAGKIELRIGEKIYGIGPAIGLIANTDGGVFGYASAYSDIKYQDYVFTPFAGLGGYSSGDSSNLGGVFQFRLGLGAAYQFPTQHRLGIQVGHISNAGSHSYNPGEEELFLTYAVPFRINR